MFFIARSSVDCSFLFNQICGMRVPGCPLSKAPPVVSSFLIMAAEVRLIEAKRKIYEGDKNISAIAYELGYAHSQHFQRAFKNRFGVTPGSLLK